MKEIKEGVRYVMKYTKRGIFVLILVLTSISYILINLVIYNFHQQFNFQNKSNKIISVKFPLEDKEKVKIVSKDLEKCNIKQKEDLQQQEVLEWRIKIPTIKVDAKICEGVTNDVIAKTVGHFEESSKWNGNVALAAHNRGYPVNYFERLKELKQGDEIIYRTCYGEKIYNVNLITVINDSDWSYLKNSNENIITLITCVENEPKLRRCIQARERKN